MTKELISIIAAIITICAFLPYIRSIIIGQTKPHVFSWIIWAITTLTVFVAQLSDNGGAGAWVTGFSGSLTIIIAVIAYSKRHEIDITKSDIIFFVTALSTIPLWYITSNPLWSVIILCIVDFLGFVPTLRKSYFDPYSEKISFFSLVAFKYSLSIVAMENYSFVTLLFPFTIITACLMLVLLIILRRKNICAI